MKVYAVLFYCQRLNSNGIGNNSIILLCTVSQMKCVLELKYNEVKKCPPLL